MWCYKHVFCCVVDDQLFFGRDWHDLDSVNLHLLTVLFFDWLTSISWLISNQSWQYWSECDVFIWSRRKLKERAERNNKSFHHLEQRNAALIVCISYWLMISSQLIQQIFTSCWRSWSKKMLNLTSRNVKVTKRSNKQQLNTEMRHYCEDHRDKTSQHHQDSDHVQHLENLVLLPVFLSPVTCCSHLVLSFSFLYYFVISQ